MSNPIDYQSISTLKPPLWFRILSHIARCLLGALFAFAGLNVLFKWFMPPLEQQPEFAQALIKTGYMIQLIAITELFVGILLLCNRLVAFAVVVLTPLVVNIVAFHLFKERAGLAIAIIVLLLWALLVWSYRSAYAPLFVARRVPGK